MKLSRLRFCKSASSREAVPGALVPTLLVGCKKLSLPAALILVVALTACFARPQPQPPIISPSSPAAPETPTAQALTTAIPAYTPPAADETDGSLAHTLPELDDFRAAMREAFYGDIDPVAATAPRYVLDVTLHTDTDPPSLSGVQSIWLSNTWEEPLDSVQVRLFPNTPSYGGEMRVTYAAVDGIAVRLPTGAFGHALRVPLELPLPPGEAVAVTLHFEADIPTHTDHGYGIFSFTNGIYALAGFYPSTACLR